MKKTAATLVVVITMVISLHAFRINQNSGIKGNLLPADGVLFVYGINKRDTLKAIPGREGFFIPAMPGRWRILIDGRDPYKDMIVDDVLVEEGKIKDIGEIKLIR